MNIFETMLKQNVIPFMKDPENVLVVGEKVFAHDGTPCMRANVMQQLLKDKIDFWENVLWPGNSPDLSPAEHVGSIIKTKWRQN